MEESLLEYFYHHFYHGLWVICHDMIIFFGDLQIMTRIKIEMILILLRIRLVCVLNVKELRLFVILSIVLTVLKRLLLDIWSKLLLSWTEIAKSFYMICTMILSIELQWHLLGHYCSSCHERHRKSLLFSLCFYHFCISNVACWHDISAVSPSILYLVMMMIALIMLEVNCRECSLLSC
jgi:hypothetical protein